MNRALYRAVDVWRRQESGDVARYRCFELPSRGGYCVQSRDGYRPAAGLSYVEDLDRQFMELLAEEAPDSRSATLPTLEKAIAACDRSFNEEYPPDDSGRVRADSSGFMCH